MSVEISIIIVVKDDVRIENTLRCLERQASAYKSEIIVVDASNHRLDNIKYHFKHVKWINYKSGIKKITIPEQRNIGIKISKGNIIIFIDANCVPCEDWLIKLIEPIRKRQEFVVAGSVRPLDKKSVNTINDFNSNVLYLKSAPTINIAFDNQVIVNTGYFDERFEYGSDIDYTWRVQYLGYKIRYVYDAMVFHSWGDLKDEVRRSFRYGNARVNLYLKHRNRILRIIEEDQVGLFYLFYILLLPLSVYFPLILSVIFIPILKNIKKENLYKRIGLNLIYAIGIFWGIVRQYI